MAKTIKEEAEAQGSARIPVRPRKEGTMGGIILIVLGVLFLGNNFLPRFDFSDYWPLILVAIGVTLLIRSRQS